MKNKIPRFLRIVAAGIFFVLCCTGVLLQDWSGWVYKIQFGPAFMKTLMRFAPGSLFAAASILVLTFCVGRLYCSILCPLGILQDIFCIFRKRFRKQGGYRPLRWGIFAAVVVMALVGFSLPLILLMPGSTFALIFNQIFCGTAGFIARRTSVYPAMSGFILTWCFFLLLLFISAWRGRLYCNTLCPVGTVLSLAASRSVFRIHFTDQCVHCGLCERSCKTGCIDAAKGCVDNANCVMCFNCLSVCQKQGLVLGRTEKKVPVFSPERRTFLSAGTCMVGALGAGMLFGRSRSGKDSFGNPPAMPPGAGNYEDFSKRCIACGLCVSACTGKVLAHAGMQYGLRGVMQPYMRFSDGECSYNCRACMEACPCGALENLPLKIKQRTAVGISVYNPKNCISYVNGEDCGACSEHCPVGAIVMTPYKKTTIPKINDALCIGCGACQHICPAYPVPAVQVHGFSVQQMKDPPKKTESKALPAEKEFPF